MTQSSRDELLNALLQCVRGVGAEAEQRLNSMGQVAGHGGALVDMVADVQVPLDARQLAAIVLKSWIRIHWDDSSPEFAGPIASSDEKDYIRRKVIAPELLGDADSKLRTSLALCLSVIADVEPDSWSSLMEVLLAYMSPPHSQNTLLVEGAVRCFALLVEDASPDSMCRVAAHALHRLLNMLNYSDNNLLLKMKAHCAIHSIIDGLLDARSEEENALQVLDEFAPVYIEVVASLRFVVNSQELRNSPEYFGVLREAAACISTLVGRHISPIKRRGVELGELMCSFLNAVTPIYMSDALIYDQNEGRQVDFCVDQVLSCLCLMCEKFPNHLRRSLLDRLAAHTHFLLTLIEISDDDAALWEADIVAFWVAEEENVTISTRMSRREILESAALVSRDFANTILQSCSERLTALPSLSWKQVDAIVVAIGLATPSATQLDEFAAQIFIPSLFNVARLGFHGALVACRAMRVVVELVENLSAMMKVQLMEAITTILRADNYPHVKATACVIIAALCSKDQLFALYFLGSDHIEEVINTTCSVVRDCGCSDRISDDLLSSLLTPLEISSDCLSPIMKEQILNVTLFAWQQNAADSILASTVADIVGAFASSNADARALLQVHFVPSLIQLFDNLAAPSSAVELSFTIADRIIRASQQDELNRILMESVLPRLFERLASSDDEAVLSQGASFLASCIQNADLSRLPNGESLLRTILSVLEHLLKTLPDHASRTSVQLASAIFDKISSSNIIAYGLVSALASRFVTSADLMMSQELVVALSHMIMSNCDTIITVLEQSGFFEAVLRKWLSVHSDLHAPIAVKSSVVVLSLFLERIEPHLRSIMVDGYQIVNVEAPRRTRRSQGPQAIEMNRVPATTKIVSLLIDEWVRNRETLNLQQDLSPSDEDDEESGDDIEESLDTLVSMASDQYEVDDEIQLRYSSAAIDSITPVGFAKDFMRKFACGNPSAFQHCFQNLQQNDQGNLLDMIDFNTAQRADFVLPSL